MSAPSPSTALSQTAFKQLQAADPRRSAWVSANAGSGKTYVLVQRIIRLMLAGADPGKILALTYTTAAAANMANRVFKTLSEWTGLDDAALGVTLRALGEEPNKATLKRARQLFARAIETPGGLKIQTIHAFCERVLHLFPFEANVPAKFDVLDDVQAAELTGEALHDMLLAALSGAHPDLADALGRVVDQAAESTLKDLIRTGIHLRQRLSEEGEITREGVVEDYLGLAPHRNSEDVFEDMVGGALPPSAWSMAIAALEEAGDLDSAAQLQAALDDDDPENRALYYLGLFLTQKQTFRAPSRFLTGLKKHNPALRDVFLSELERLQPLREEMLGHDTADRTRALMVLVDAVLDRYRQKKIARGALDFADLIARTRALLSRAGSRFVLYKLDSGISHLLVDEAQDTSPAQWDIMQELTSEFFDGEAAHSEVRTIFAVGDPKQSIYSFQGADPESFEKTKRTYQTKLKRLALALDDPEQELLPLELTVSFRSAPLVLQSVDLVFQNERAKGVQDPGTTHESVRLNAPAHIELWDIPETVKSEERDIWQLPVDETDEQAPVVKVAHRIAQEVARWLAPNATETIEENGSLRPIRAGDIMILVRQRGVLFDRVIRALKERGIPVAGADRLILNAHIAVLDLVSLGRAMLLPDDDLALAEILTSPLFGLDDYDLLRFAPQRGAQSLEAALRTAATTHPTYAAAVAKLDQWRQLAREGGAFSFYARILGAGRARRAMLGRLGPEAGDAVDEFLRVALDHDRRNIPSLALFLATFDESEIQIKRDMDLAGDQVRVMTVHGAKGLEAPIVILPDTCSPPDLKQIDKLSIYRDAQGRRFPLWAAGRDKETQTVNQAREAMVATLRDEYRRLLYVAMTRAKDRLIVAGFHHTTPSDECWYKMIESALEGQWTAQERHGEPIRVMEDRKSLPQAQATPMAQPRIEALPSWLGEAAPPPETGPQPLRPSAGNVFSGGDAQAQRLALAVGQFAHRLLEILPDCAPERRAEIAARYAQARGQAIPQDKREAIIASVLALLEAPALTDLFGPGSRGEVDLSGFLQRETGPALPIFGQVDRMAVTAKDVIIADYKTNAVPPASEAGISPSYIEQLALYRAVIAPLYPDRAIRCVLIYTSNQSVFDISEPQLEAALQRLRSGPVST